MKKLLVLLTSFFMLIGCSVKPDVKYNYDIKYSDADMTGYNDMKDVEVTCFKKVTASELYNCVENKGSGIFYLGYDTCPFCNKCIKYLNEEALDMGVTIYYIDAMNEEEPIIGNNENIRKLTNFLMPILEEDKESGKKVLMTPHIFSIVNGEFFGSYVSLPYKINGDVDFDNPPTERQIKKIKNIYKLLFEPFVE